MFIALLPFSSSTLYFSSVPQPVLAGIATVYVRVSRLLQLQTRLNMALEIHLVAISFLFVIEHHSVFFSANHSCSVIAFSLSIPCSIPPTRATNNFFLN